MVGLVEEIYKVENLTSLPYEELTNLSVGKAVIKAAVNRWEELGFLDKIEDEVKKEQISVAFDNMAHDLLTENERVVKIEKRYNFNCAPDNEEHIRGSLSATFDFAVFIFPLIRRVACKIDNFKYDTLLDILEKLSFIAINYDGYEFECDIEAEFCAMLSLLIEEHFKILKNNE